MQEIAVNGKQLKMGKWCLSRWGKCEWGTVDEAVEVNQFSMSDLTLEGSR